VQRIYRKKSKRARREVKRGARVKNERNKGGNSIERGREPAPDAYKVDHRLTDSNTVNSRGEGLKRSPVNLSILEVRLGSLTVAHLGTNIEGPLILG